VLDGPGKYELAVSAVLCCAVTPPMSPPFALVLHSFVYLTDIDVRISPLPDYQYELTDVLCCPVCCAVLCGVCRASLVTWAATQHVGTTWLTSRR
jgi:hypothetical protein